MLTMKKMLARGALAALVSTAAIATMTTTASAYVVCDRYGDCYNVRPHHHYWPRGSAYYGSQGYDSGYYGSDYYGQQYQPGISFGFNFGGRDHRDGNGERRDGDRGGWDRGNGRGDGDHRDGGGHDHWNH